MPTQIHVITLEFRNLRQDSKASVLLHEENHFRWCSTSMQADGGTRFCIGTLHGSPLSIRQFVINGREVFWETYGACDVIYQQLCVCGVGADLRGTVELPSGGSVTLKSPIDRTSVIGQSSFALAIKNES